jgi:hypothetical protein
VPEVWEVPFDRVEHDRYFGVQSAALARHEASAPDAA